MIDGDIVLFRAASGSSSKFDFGDVTLESDNQEDLRSRVREDIQGILELTGCKDYIFCLSGSRNYRKEHFPTYKTNRVSEKPSGHDALKRWAMDNIKCKYRHNLEGDDVMGILCTKYPKEYAIYSIDKDMKTIPTMLWDFHKGHFFKQSIHAANHFLYTQVLTGDPTDGYKGIPGIGKVKAEKILDGCNTEEEMAAATLGAYIEYYGYTWIAVDQMQQQLGQARILHHKDYQDLSALGITYLGPLKQLSDNY